MSHGINANVVHGWRKLAREASAVTRAEPRESSFRWRSQRLACRAPADTTSKSNCAAAP